MTIQYGRYFWFKVIQLEIKIGEPHFKKILSCEEKKLLRMITFSDLETF
jgi:hypothetical protein